MRETSLNKSNNVLRLNVGFLLKENVGYSRELIFDEPMADLADDLTINNLQGSITLTRTPQGLYVQGRLKATTQAECVRCLTKLDQPVSSRLSEIFHYPPEKAPEDGLTIPEDMNVDFAPLVREDMLLSVPMRQLCRPDCKGLCPTCGKNWNEGPCDCEDEPGDPRWDGTQSAPSAGGDPRLSVLKKLIKDQPD